MLSDAKAVCSVYIVTNNINANKFQNYFNAFLNGAVAATGNYYAVFQYKDFTV